MLLSDVRSYIKQQGQASISEMVFVFNVEPDALHGMLSHLILKGCVQEVKESAFSCGSSSQCSGCTNSSACAMFSGNETFQWIRPDNEARNYSA